MPRVGVVIAVMSAVCLGLIASAMAQDSPSPKKLNPYTAKTSAIAEGRALYIRYGCSACHGVGGGGGMGPSLIKDRGPAWKFGSSDEALYKLIKGEIPGATMPKGMGQGMSDDEIWKVLAYVRSLYGGDQGKVNW
jgi:mono/diheme cytochrome c family protein